MELVSPSSRYLQRRRADIDILIDLHEYLGGASLIPSAHPHPITGEKVPLTLGHEFSGTVVEVGEGVTTHKIGDRVCVQPIIFDGTCGACVDGYINCCYSNGFIGLSGKFLSSSSSHEISILT